MYLSEYCDVKSMILMKFQQRGKNAEKIQIWF